MSPPRKLSRAARTRAVPGWALGRNSRPLRALEAVERRAIIQRYAMLSASRRPVLCQSPLNPTASDIASRGKVVFRTLIDATDCAMALHWKAGSQPMRPYRCRGHFHLKTDLENGLR